MRVAILGRDFPPTVGGIADHTDLMAADLARRGIDVTVVCSAPADQRSAFVVSPSIERWDAKGFDDIVAAVAATQPDVIVWQYNPFAVGHRGVAPTARVLARKLSHVAPIALFAHELWFPWGREGARGLVWAVAQRLQTRAVLRACTRWIITTQAREEALKRIDPARVVRIPVGTNVAPTGSRDRARWNIPEDAFVLAHLGSAGPGRDLEPAFRALSTLRARTLDVRLFLVGNTGPFPIPASLEGAVMTTGTRPLDELSDALACADAYLHADPVGPSAGRRTTLVAALAHGLPVIAYRGPDHDSHLVDGDNILMIDRDAASLVTAVESLRTEPARARSLGDAARATYSSVFSWDVIGAQIEDVLRGCAR